MLRALGWTLSGQLHTCLLYFPTLHSPSGLSTTEFTEVEERAWIHRERSVDVCVVYDDSTSSECSTNLSSPWLAVSDSGLSFPNRTRFSH